MTTLADIRSAYAPVQPGAAAQPELAAYQEFQPAPALQPYIYCYWHLHSGTTASTPFSYRVVADGCMDVFFDRSYPAASFVMGFCPGFTQFDLPVHFDYFGIRFLPGMLPLLFRLHAAALHNTDEALNEVLPDLALFLAGRADPDLDAAGLCQMFDLYFAARLPHVQADGRLYGAVAEIIRAGGRLQVGRDLDTGLSSRQLQRLFLQYVGDTPKVFSKIVRFQQVLRAHTVAWRSGLPVALPETGYYDQAHLIREFRAFYGETPGRVLK